MRNYQEMLSYVKECLAKYDAHGGKAKRAIVYNRYAHTERVYGWMQVLYEGYENKDLIDLESLTIATIFHDIGYCSEECGDNHAEVGAKLCREYLENNTHDLRIDFICELIAKHSDKELMSGTISPELLLLMEADLLDDTGAQGVVMDIWIEAKKEEPTFESMLEHIGRYTQKEMQNNPMVTPRGRSIWEEKRRLVNTFVESYQKDLKPSLFHITPYTK